MYQSQTKEKMGDWAKKRLAKEKAEARISLSSIYDVLAVTERFPTQELLVEALAKKGLPLNWSGSLVLIGRAVVSKGLEGSGCRHCPLHCKV